MCATGLLEHCFHLFHVLLFVIVDFIGFPRKVLALLGESNGFLQKVMVLFNKTNDFSQQVRFYSIKAMISYRK